MNGTEENPELKELIGELIFKYQFNAESPEIEFSITLINTPDAKGVSINVKDTKSVIITADALARHYIHTHKIFADKQTKEQLEKERIEKERSEEEE